MKKIKAWTAICGDVITWADKNPQDLKEFVKRENRLLQERAWKVVPCEIHIKPKARKPKV